MIETFFRDYTANRRIGGNHFEACLFAWHMLCIELWSRPR